MAFPDNDPIARAPGDARGGEGVDSAFDSAMQDEFAFTSQKRASKALKDGAFKNQILPIEIKTRKGIDVFENDEHLKPNTTMESLSGLRTAFKKDGVVTAGNASGINDGASALILANEEKA